MKLNWNSVEKVYPYLLIEVYRAKLSTKLNFSRVQISLGFFFSP